LIAISRDRRRGIDRGVSEPFSTAAAESTAGVQVATHESGFKSRRGGQRREKIWKEKARITLLPGKDFSSGGECLNPSTGQSP
jgi:hypothetical protein